MRIHVEGHRSDISCSTSRAAACKSDSDTYLLGKPQKAGAHPLPPIAGTPAPALAKQRVTPDAHELLLKGRYEQVAILLKDKQLSSAELTWLGIAERMLDRDEKAYGHFTEAIEKDPRNWRALAHRAAVLLKNASDTSAERDASAALAVNSRCSLALLCGALAETDYKKSVHFLGEIIARHPDSDAAWTVFAQVAWIQADMETAEKMARTAIGLNPRNGRAWAILAQRLPPAESAHAQYEASLLSPKTHSDLAVLYLGLEHQDIELFTPITCAFSN